MWRIVKLVCWLHVVEQSTRNEASDLRSRQGHIAGREIEPVRAGISTADAVEFGFLEPEMTPSFSR